MSWLKRLFRGSARPAGPTPDSPPALAADLLEAEAMAAELRDYLLGNRLFRQIVVDTPEGTRRPKMTLGALYERIEHLGESAVLGSGDRQRLSAVTEAWETSRRQYPDQVREKLNREKESYLKNWRYFLENRKNEGERWKEDYAVESRNRRRVELVLRLLGPDADPGLLEDLDALERAAKI